MGIAFTDVPLVENIIYYYNMCYLKGETVVTMWIIHVK